MSTESKPSWPILTTKDEFRFLVDLVLQHATADHTRIFLHDQNSGTSRFANNQIIQNLNLRKVSFSITSAFGIRHGTASTTDLTAGSVKETLKKYLNGRTSGWLFVTNRNTQASTDSIRIKLRRTLGKDYVNPHSLRHGLATELLNNGVDVYDVKEVLNHNSVTITEKYIHLSPEHTINKIRESHPFV